MEALVPLSPVQLRNRDSKQNLQGRDVARNDVGALLHDLQVEIVHPRSGVQAGWCRSIGNWCTSLVRTGRNSLALLGAGFGSAVGFTYELDPSLCAMMGGGVGSLLALALGGKRQVSKAALSQFTKDALTQAVSLLAGLGVRISAEKLLQLAEHSVAQGGGSTEWEHLEPYTRNAVHVYLAICSAVLAVGTYCMWKGLVDRATYAQDVPGQPPAATCSRDALARTMHYATPLLAMGTAYGIGFGIAKHVSPKCGLAYASNALQTVFSSLTRDFVNQVTEGTVDEGPKTSVSRNRVLYDDIPDRKGHHASGELRRKSYLKAKGLTTILYGGMYFGISGSVKLFFSPSTVSSLIAPPSVLWKNQFVAILASAGVEGLDNAAWIKMSEIAKDAAQISMRFPNGLKGAEARAKVWSNLKKLGDKTRVSYDRQTGEWTVTLAPARKWLAHAGLRMIGNCISGMFFTIAAAVESTKPSEYKGMLALGTIVNMVTEWRAVIVREQVLPGLELGALREYVRSNGMPQFDPDADPDDKRGSPPSNEGSSTVLGQFPLDLLAIEPFTLEIVDETAPDPLIPTVDTYVLAERAPESSSSSSSMTSSSTTSTTSTSPESGIVGQPSSSAGSPSSVVTDSPPDLEVALEVARAREDVTGPPTGPVVFGF